MKRIPCLLLCMPFGAESGLHALQKMDYFVLIMWTLPVTILKCTSMPFLTILWIGSLDKTLQLYCLCCVSFAATLTGSSGMGAFNQDYVFVTPVEVDSSGAYISHDILHSSRKKRSTRSSKPSSMHYRISAFGQELHLELQPSSLLSREFAVQVLGKDGYLTDVEHSAEPCFYQGFIRDYENSSVAISTCVGMSGFLRTLTSEYFISPLPEHLAEKHNVTAPGGHHPHVLYKRSAESTITLDREISLSSSIHQTPQSLQKQHFCGKPTKHSSGFTSKDTHIRSDEHSHPPRLKRSAAKFQQSNSLVVETLVVADKKMVEKHGKESVTTYILTVMNMVSSLFKDGTIGSDINIVVVSLLLLEDEPSGLKITHHADQSLNNFCQWQSSYVGKNGKRHDHAILLTGLDICSWKNEPCDTLGFAPINGMCSKFRSCTINEDTGLGLAFTIAHESGHNFGMVHDGEGNPCRKTEGNIMSPTLSGNNGVFSWSACSRQYLKEFLSTAQSACLIDEPKQLGHFQYPEKLPGQIYDADTQCKWQFGPKAKQCSFVKDICKSLWCQKSGHRCETKFMPAAEGTVCGLNMWCRRGQCVRFGDHGPRSVVGGWSDWTDWSECSRTCGGGVMYQERFCNNPVPQYGGKYCQGSNRIYQICNAQTCPSNTPDFRAQQCAEYNSKPFRGWYYKWKPYTTVEEENICKLYCTAEDFDFFFALSNKVKDGTPCSASGYDVCIDGSCELVGCDYVLGSKAALDACGVCKGDNSTCKFYRGQYPSHHKTNDYYTVVTIPAGARSIHFQEIEVSTSYLAVRNLNKKYYLTGDWTIDWPGKFSFAGTVFNYQRPFQQTESLYAPGPTNETLVLEILYQGKNGGFTWEYTLQYSLIEENPVKKTSYSWVPVYTDCSVTCGGGFMTVKFVCLQDLQIQVNSSLCSSLNKPSPEQKPCNTQHCPAYWIASDWSACSASCGGGEQTRSVLCVHRTAQGEELVGHSHCPVSTPIQVQKCHIQDCPAEWSTGPWSQCSRSCGKGIRKREVYCRSVNFEKYKILPADLCPASSKPESTESCMLARCQKNDKLQWVISAWTECSTTCGPGVRKRELKCGEKDIHGKIVTVPQRRCRSVRKVTVPLEQPCNNKPCPVQTPYTVYNGWHASTWQPCTVTCGGGVQIRNVQCLHQGRPAVGCVPNQKPPTSQACNMQFCPSTGVHEDPSCVDYFSWCSLVPQHGVCNHKFYGKQCCKSCTRKKHFGDTG
ncbi:A disintegrin and metalloproteinase with thrombospondin motifs 18 isoform X2 [Lithobates pipiens]